MPRGPDLSPNEVAMVHSKIKQFWNYEKARIIDGGIKEIRKSCKASGIPISRATVCRIAAEMKAQELASDQFFEETGEVAGLDFTSNRVGKCGRLSQLTDAVKEVYREIISRYAHSWIYLSERTLVTELKKKGHNFPLTTVHRDVRWYLGLLLQQSS